MVETTPGTRPDDPADIALLIEQLARKQDVEGLGREVRRLARLLAVKNDEAALTSRPIFGLTDVAADVLGSHWKGPVIRRTRNGLPRVR